MKTRLSGIVALAGISMTLLSASSAHAAYVFVGSWDLGTLSNTYYWQNNPAVYSGQEAGAFLFGGSASQYAISTIDSNVANINHLAFVDGWGDDQFLLSPTSESFKLDTGGPGYNDPFGGPSYSALVRDHAPVDGNGHFINFAFRDASIAAVPEPSPALALIFGALTLTGAVMYRRRRTTLS